MSDASLAPEPQMSEATGQDPRKRLPQVEFICLIAMLFATIGLSIDGMLPALPEIAAELAPSDPNKVQLIVLSFMLGMGLGTLFTGPLSDRFGRRPVMICGAILYSAACVLAYVSQSLELLLIARFVQGLGAAAPRVVSLALVRDLYSGPEMARIVSFGMMVFALVPAIAPSIGAVIILMSSWRAIFLSFVVFSAISMLWLLSRQPETLAVENRRPFKIASLINGAREVILHPIVSLIILVQGFCFGILFATLSSSQLIFDQTFDQGANFPLWFMLISILAASGSLLNARIVERVGMRRIVVMTFAGVIAMTLLYLGLTLGHVLSDRAQLGMHVAWTVVLFFQAGLTLGNLNALAMAPMGHLAGMAASVSGAVATIMGVVLAVPIGLAFDGTPVPLVIGTLVLSVGALLMMQYMLRRETALA